MLGKYSDMVFKVAYTRTKNSHDAEDIMQDVFLRYIRSKPCFESEEHEKAWFIRVTINRTKSLLTSSWFRKTTVLDDRLSVNPAQKSDVYYAVMALPKDMRTVIHLYYYEDYSIREIAKLLFRSESYVKSILMRARKKLKITLEENNE
ncbi:MAG: RNA polymerase subunit sigma-24 [Firmicutes bacterium HGW-Firmicutes-21]|nr:MAG: RNA polymerase subunit sigma-24 [Firmicutes bacterium HGW-Firmicutes-21]